MGFRVYLGRARGFGGYLEVRFTFCNGFLRPLGGVPSPILGLINWDKCCAIGFHCKSFLSGIIMGTYGASRDAGASF